MLCFPQVLFAGAVVPWDSMPDVGRWTSVVLVNRWGYDALGSVLGVGTAISTPWGGWVLLVGLATLGLLVTHEALLRRMRPA